MVPRPLKSRTCADVFQSCLSKIAFKQTVEVLETITDTTVPPSPSRSPNSQTGCTSFFHSAPDVTKTRNGEWGMGNGEWGMGMGNGKLKMGN